MTCAFFVGKEMEFVRSDNAGNGGTSICNNCSLLILKVPG